MTLSLEQARTIIRAALEKRIELGLRPIAVAVRDFASPAGACRRARARNGA